MTRITYKRYACHAITLRLLSRKNSEIISDYDGGVG